MDFHYEAITQARTNHPDSVEGAALGLVCRWWDQEPETIQNKTADIIKVVKEMGKDRLVSWIEEKLLGRIDEDEVEVTHL